MTIEKQIREWKELKRLCDKISLSRGLAKKENLEEFYTNVRTYYQTYKTKFDFNDPPK